MENYEEKYKQALETARKINSGEGVAAPKDWSTLEVIFPELRKSENERIKTNIIKLLRFIRDAHHQYFDECNEAINWLENNPMFDMPKIKFKVGDWVIFNNDKLASVYKVEKIEKYAYILRHILGGSMPLTFYSQDCIRPWTIQDAKDGDVLVCEGKISKIKNGQGIGIVKNYVGRIGGCDNCFETYCFIDWDGNFRVSEAMGSPNIHPATKEQRDILFQKIKEAGYEWDSNKKKRFYTMKTIIDEVKHLNNDINNTITELVKARLAHNDAAVASIHHKMESLMVETQQVCSFIIDNPPNENLDEAADCYLENIQPVGFMEGDYDGTQILDAFKTGADWQKNRDKQILSNLYDDCSLLKDSLDKVTTGNLSHRISNVKFSITGMQVFIKQELEDR